MFNPEQQMHSQLSVAYSLPVYQPLEHQEPEQSTQLPSPYRQPPQHVPAPSTSYVQQGYPQITYQPQVYQPYDAGTQYSSLYDRRQPDALQAGVQYQSTPGNQSAAQNLDRISTPKLTVPLNQFALGDALPAEHPPAHIPDQSTIWPVVAKAQDPASNPTSKSKKSRREKPRIDLAPDQPPTTQGKPRARVFVACLQCRTRKIRCDGAKPTCHNCVHRPGNKDCNYDPVPKRRGPDRIPGARNRPGEAPSDGPRRRRRPRELGNSVPISRAVSATSSDTQPDKVQNEPITQDQYFDQAPIPVNVYPRSPFIVECGCHGLVDCPLVAPHTFVPKTHVYTYHTPFEITPHTAYNLLNSGYLTELDEDGTEEVPQYEIGSEPSLCFTRKVWWDSLLSLYISPSASRLQALTVGQRESAMQGIASDLRFLFKVSNFFLSFFHIPTFFGNFFDPSKRENMQPSLILAMLSMATFWQSSEIGLGRQGRERALRFRDEAQAAMDASFNSGWIDETLAQAAWLLALFEISAHPCHSSQRTTSSLVMLDSIIRSLSLTLVDADDPNTSVFSSGSVPVVGSPLNRETWVPTAGHNQRETPDFQPSYQPGLDVGCSCRNFTLEGRWPSSSELAPMWRSTPAWDSNWSPGEIRKESARRLCWSAINIAAGHLSYTTAVRSEGLDLFITNPANYALLFSGESVMRLDAYSHNHSSKDTIWALHDRAFLLWNGCIRMRCDPRATDSEKAQFAVKAWLAADTLEAALDRHVCGIEQAFIFQAREYVFNTRMYISYEFQRFVPLVTINVTGMFHRDKAEEWLTRAAAVARRLMVGLHTITGNPNNVLARRPFFVFWFMGQIHRALNLFQCDPTLIVALDVCKSLVPPTDYLTALWPCPEQRRRYERLRERIGNACVLAGVEPPGPFDLAAQLSVPEPFI